MYMQNSQKSINIYLNYGLCLNHGSPVKGDDDGVHL